MSGIEFREAVRGDVQLLILLAGGTGTGKTESALRLATGIAETVGGTIAGIDTEHGRMLHKADDYKISHYAELEEPFTPERYAEAIHAADALGPAVIVVDSGSHEHDGAGGVLEIQLAEFERLGKRESARMASWIEPKRRHKLYVRELLRTRAHVIVCHRAEDKIEIVKVNGETVVRPRESFTGTKGWIPICERRLPFEATISLVLTPDHPGVPLPVKLERRHADLIRLDAQLDEDTGRRLARWAAGAKTGAAPQGHPATSGAGDELQPDVDRVLELARSIGAEELTKAEGAIATRRGKGQLDAEWLGRLESSLQALVPAEPETPAAEDDPEVLFPIPETARGSTAYQEGRS